jgi:molybdate transport system substrate-binding protein
MSVKGIRVSSCIGLLLLGLFATGTEAVALESGREMLVYCGITMVSPLTEIARIVEKEQDIKIVISQGGSEDLYQSLKKSGQGDLYLPGESSYYALHVGEGLLGDYVLVGYNQAALVVKKGNPKNVKPSLDELLRDDLVVMIGSPESGSVGMQTKRILEAAGIYEKVERKAVSLAPDSRNLNAAMRRGEADLIVNWRATAFFPDNSPVMDVVDLDPAIARLEPLMLIFVKNAKYPEVARRFMDFTASAEGQAIFRKHGFIDNTAPAPQ